MNPVHVVGAVRTTFGRCNGALSSIRPDDLAARTVPVLLTRSPALDPARFEDICSGNAHGAGATGVSAIDPQVGDPHGASGARLAGTVTHHLARRCSGTGVATFRIGVGQGLALALAHVR